MAYVTTEALISTENGTLPQRGTCAQTNAQGIQTVSTRDTVEILLLGCVARNIANFRRRTDGEGDQVQAVLDGLLDWQSRNDATLYLLLIIQVELTQCAFQTCFLHENEGQKSSPPDWNQGYADDRTEHNRNSK